jgi:aspartate racemase
VRHEEWEASQRYLAEKVDRLERVGVDVIVCVSNTMHRVLEPIMAMRETPFIHIADPTGEAIAEAKLKTVGLLGTLPVMRSEALRQRYQGKFGIEILVPVDADKISIDRIIFDELVRRELKASSKQEFLRVVADLRRAGAQGVILGCTEIFLLIDQQDLPGFPVFDTTALHVAAAIDYVLKA